MRIRFRGVRGSVPWATMASIGVGCNTPCVELTDEAAGRTLVLDAGSGIVGLGETMTGPPHPVDVLLTHYHWDHLQGLPFFAPLFQPGWRPTIWMPTLSSEIPLDALFASPFFPVPFERLPSRPAAAIVRPGRLRIGPFEVRAQPLHHPGGAFAYRIRGEAGDLVYATDHEFGDEAVDLAFGAFIHGAAAVILDAHFTPAERPAHAGWGHGDWDQCARFAAAHGVAHLWLFHHKPGRTDEALRTIEADARGLFPATDLAVEGTTFHV
ncbi:MAG: MBL fold metallo-hydrolase [Acidobacteriota bacterium]|nr:MBL fold metallo-hydrolase [Acidobacteriota bacterium]